MSEDSENTMSSFAIVIEPDFDERGEWDGRVTAHMEEDVHNDLDVDDLNKIRSVCGMMASTLTLMEQDPDFMEYVREYFLSNYQNLIDQFIEDTENLPSFTRSDDGKVINLNFNTKTHGSA